MILPRAAWRCPSESSCELAVGCRCAQSTGEEAGKPRRDRMVGAGTGRVLHSSIVIAQIAYWVGTKEGRARTRLQQWLRRSVEALEGRILNFNAATAHVW